MHKPIERRTGFTVVELMIVVAIIGLLVTIAVPQWLRARMRAANTKFINDLRVHSQAIDNYASDHQKYPPDLPPGVLTPPPGDQAPFRDYVAEPAVWEQPTAIGGQWDLQNNAGSMISAVGAANYDITAMQLNLLDDLGDNNDPATGHMRTDGAGYYMVVE